MMLELSPEDVKYELEHLRSNLYLEETEDSWEKIGQAIKTFVRICENGGYDASPTEVLKAFKSFHRPIISAMNSERTRLCLIPMDLICAAGTTMGKDFEPLLPLYMQPLLTLCGRTNKVMINRARSTILSIIGATQLSSVLTYFLQKVKDKSATIKLVIAEGTLACLNSCNPPDLEKDTRATEIETIIRTTARDANADVRKISKKIFESYKILLPSRVQSFTGPLSPTTKKYLEIKSGAIPTQRSIANLRATTKNNAPPLPSSNNIVKPSHSRTTSSSTASGTTSTSNVRNQPSIMTRVGRKDPATSAQVANVSVKPQVVNPSVKPQVANASVKPSQSTRVVSEPSQLNTRRHFSTTDATTSKQETKLTIPQSRTLPVINSRPGVAASSGPPRRLQVNREANDPSKSDSQTLAPSGPRRVPMPPPPTPPAPKEEGPKRNAVRVDTSLSTSNLPVVPQAPMKKPVSILSSSLKDRAPPPKPAFVPKSRKEGAVSTAASASSTTATSKPSLVAKAKPLWGRSTVVAKAPAISQKAKTLIKKPVIVPSKNSSKPPNARSVTPAMVALPPSPTPDEEEKEKGAVGTDIQEQKNEVEDNHELEEKTTETQEANSPVPLVDAASAQEEVQEDAMEVSQNEPSTVISGNETAQSPNVLTNEKVDDSVITANNDDPYTPVGPLPKPLGKGMAAMASKTPISALLSSIERGFILSPITPMSPAELYLPNINGATPYSHQLHAPRIEGPMPSFNYALHPPPGDTGFFGFGSYGTGRREEDVVRSEIGVVNINDHHKPYIPSSLPMDDRRYAFSQINQ